MPTHATSLSIPQLRAAVSGRVIVPDDAEYDEFRAVFIGSIDRRPAVIVRPADAADVAHVVSLARETGMELAVRGGGHSIPGFGTSEGGIVLDMSSMQTLEIDVEARTAWAEAGLTAGAYTAAAGPNGLATGFGDTGVVGLGGLTLGGGIGFLSRKYGLTIDHLLAVDLVTADGQLIRADAEHNPDLFWALRGGGGNFGVATRFQFRLHQVDSVVGGMLILPASPETLAAFIAEAEAAPDELSGIVNIMVAPPMPFLPDDVHGQLIMMGMLCYAGPTDSGERAVAPFRELTTPIADMIGPMRYPEIYRLTEEIPKPMYEAARSVFLDSLDRDTAAALLDGLQAATAPMAVAQLRVLGGAIARVPADATAYAHRDRRIMAAIGAVFESADESDVHEAWVVDVAKALRQGEPGVYINFVGDEGDARVREAYPDSTWARLAAVKAQYDPTNLFRLNQNIPPAASSQGG